MHHGFVATAQMADAFGGEARIDAASLINMQSENLKNKERKRARGSEACQRGSHVAGPPSSDMANPLSGQAKR